MRREINDFCILLLPADSERFVQQFNQIRYFKDFRSITSFALCKPIQSERPFLLPRFLKPPEAHVHSEEDVDHWDGLYRFYCWPDGHHSKRAF